MNRYHSVLTKEQSGSGFPFELGFRMPAEWELHHATWLIWPHNRADWEIKMASVDWCYVEVVRYLVGSERVVIICQNRRVEQRVRRRLKQACVDLDQVDTYRLATNRSWIRDSGPIFVVQQKSNGLRNLALTDWRFNGWARYRAWQRDNLLPRRIAQRLKLQRFNVVSPVVGGKRSVVLEGGSIDVNGSGLLLATEECLLGKIQARNPGLTRSDLEVVFRNYLGVRKVLWLGHGVVGDDTNGHIDNVARFVSNDTVVAAEEKDPSDENHRRLKDNLIRLSHMTDSKGKQLRVVRLPMPSPLFFGEARLPISYLNFYISNHRVLVPTFNDPLDRVALNRLARVFPSREVVGIHSVDLALGLGAVHCITQQEPSTAIT